MVSGLASSAVDRGFEARSRQTKDYKIEFVEKEKRLVGSESGVIYLPVNCCFIELSLNHRITY